MDDIYFVEKRDKWLERHPLTARGLDPNSFLVLEKKTDKPILCVSSEDVCQDFAYMMNWAHKMRTLKEKEVRNGAGNG